MTERIRMSWDPGGTESKYSARLSQREEALMAAYTPEQQEEIRYKMRILSSLAYFIGKDFHIPVELNEPGAGWHWNFEKNIIRVDPKDVLEKPLEYLRFVICHEGGHRRISRTEFIPLKEWQELGFSFLMNVIEDPRDNNFVAENYAVFREQMRLAYIQDLDFEAKAREKAAQKLGYQPRFMQAGFEYIKQWFRETQGLAPELSPDLPEDVKAAVQATLASAQDSWLRYPSRKEADTSEELITQYARVSYEINREEIWPEFRKLVEKDLEDQKMQEFLKEMKQGELGDLKDAFDALPDEKKKELAEKAKATLKEFEGAINVEIQGKLSDDPEKKAIREAAKPVESKDDVPKPAKPPTEGTGERKPKKEARNDQAARRKKLEAVLEAKGTNPYDKALEQVSDLIDLLTADLRDVFVKRKKTKHESGYRSGRRWNVRKRIQEIIARIPLFKSDAREQQESESEETDYAVTLMVDLSGSMNGKKIQEAFKSVIVLAKTLDNLGVRFEIVGFQDMLLEFKTFDEPFDGGAEQKMNQMLLEVVDGNPGGHNNSQDNDDGTCLLQASQHLAVQQAKNKFLIVLSDGKPAMGSGRKASAQLVQELHEAIAEITGNTNQKIVGIGLLSRAVATFYENNIPGVKTKEMVEVLGELLREIIERT